MIKSPVTFLLLLLVSCSSGKLIYSFEMDHPVKSRELYYQNDTLSIEISMMPEYIKFTLFNKTNEGIKISWDELSLSINGKAYRIVHKETGVTKITDVQPPTTIPPKSTLTDALIRSDQLFYTSTPMSRPVIAIQKMFPAEYYSKKEKEKILQQKGTKYTIFFPYYISGKYVNQYYEIYLRDVKAGK